MATTTNGRPHILRNPHPRLVGVLGPEYTQSHLAFISRFGNKLDEYSLSLDESFEQLLGRVRGNVTPYLQSCLLPFYNSSQEFIIELCHMLTEVPSYVVDAFPSDVRHCLMVRQGVNNSSEIEALYSQRNAFKQCDRWLTENGLLVEQRLVDSTAVAARIVKTTIDHKYAVIGSKELAVYNGLKILSENIQKPNNITAFFVVGNRGRKAEGNPFVFYAVHMKAGEDENRVNDLIESFGFSKTPLWTYPHRTNGFWYAFQITVDKEEKLKSFHAKLDIDYLKHVQFGRMSKPITQCVKELGSP